MGLFPKDRDLNRAPDTVELEVDPSFFREPTEGFLIRLDHFLAAHLAWRSRSSIQELIRGGSVWVAAPSPERPDEPGEARVEKRPGRKLRPRTQIRIVIPEDARMVIPDEDPGPLRILFEDEDVLAVDKPPKVPVHPSGRYVAGTLIQRVHHHFREEVEAGRMAPRLCHRLDRETSGIVLIAKRGRTHPLYSRQFEDREVHKRYQAIVWGEVEGESGILDWPLAPATASKIGLKMAIREDGLPSRTDWRVARRVPGYSLLDLTLHTGRQHQIRVHLAALGHPIVGDKLYGPDENYFQRAADGEIDEEDLRVLELPRQALHHHALGFTTPSTGAAVEVISPLADDLQSFLDSKQ